VPIVSAAALVVIAIAVVVFVLRPPGRAGAPPAERQPSEATRQPAQTPPAAAAPAPANPVLEAETPAVSITDDLAQQTESARALYRAGKYDEAARAAGRVLQRAPGDAEAQRLMSDLARYARQAAAEALAGLGAARTRAESAGAPAAAGGAFARAIEAERNARRLFGAGDYARAATAGYAAQGLFDAAATEALGRARADPEPQPAPPAPTPPAPPPVAPSSGVTGAETALPPVATVPVPAPAPPPSRPAPPAVTDRPAPDPQDAVRRTLQEYVSALEARSLSALKQVWPGLGGAQERAISTEFANARSISVRLDSPRIEVSGNTATVIATRRYALSTVDGHELRSDTRTTMQLHLVGTSWIIDSVRFEAER
jgi:tetratricopeptide (TPR) repeat protein